MLLFYLLELLIIVLVLIMKSSLFSDFDLREDEDTPDWGSPRPKTFFLKHNCSINELRMTSTLFDDIDKNMSDNVSVNHAKSGAVMTAYTKTLFTYYRNMKNNPGHGMTFEEYWNCHIASHRRYCDKYGYDYISFDDNVEWERERNSIIKVAPHWLKVNAILDLLNQGYPWILYVDSDTVFVNVTHSVEEFLRHSNDIGKRSEDRRVRLGATSSGTDEGTFLYLNDITSGWNCDTILVINSDRARSFFRYLYELRFPCPFCVGEQCAAHIALLDLLVYEAINNVKRGVLPAYAQVLADGRNSTLSCCHPRKHCAYPYGKSNMKKNPKHGPWSQGCERKWEKHLRFTNDLKLKQRRRTQFVAGDLRLRAYLSIAHPIKTLNECRILTGSRRLGSTTAGKDSLSIVDFERSTIKIRRSVPTENVLYLLIVLIFLIKPFCLLLSRGLSKWKC